MDKYFIVTEKSRLYNDYFNYIQNKKEIHEHVKHFLDEHGIKAKYYACLGYSLYIEPTEEDLEIFGGMLCRPKPNGLRRFKENSRIGKAWAKRLQTAHLEALSSPNMLLYLDSFIPRYRSRLFHVGTTLYGSIESDYDFTLPEEFKEIKASEFYRVLEEIEAQKDN